MKQAKLSFAKARTKTNSVQQAQLTASDAESTESGVKASHPAEQVPAEQVPVEQVPAEHEVVEVVPGVPTIEVIIKKYDEWKLAIPEDIQALHERTRRSWLAKFNVDWNLNFPWIQVVRVNDEVVGILCSFCRSKCAAGDSLFKCVKEKSQGKFIEVPFVRFGNFVEAAKAHEFGNTPVPRCGVKKYREQITNGSVDIPNTLHMRVYLSIITKTSTTTGINVRQHLSLSDTSLIQQEQASHMSISIQHRIIKIRDSPFSSFKDNVSFAIEMLHCNALKFLLRGDKGVSIGFIRDLIHAVYLLVILGIYKEIAEHLKSGEPIIFGGMIDLGSKVKKTRSMVELL